MKHSVPKKNRMAESQTVTPTQNAASHRSLFRRAAAAAVVGSLAVAGWILLNNSQNGNAATPVVSSLKLEDIPFDGAQAYEYLKTLCDIGPRPSGSTAMLAQQKLLADHFQKLGGSVEFQRFRAKHPLNGAWVSMANILVRWNPQSERRILLCAHYDTLPFPLRDLKDARGRFVGANDNASGVAILMQLARDMPKLKKDIGVDFLLLDGEEFVFDEGDPMFLGAEYFALEYVKHKPGAGYRWAILLDMVGDADLEIFQENKSLRWKDTRPLVKEVWATAAKLGVREFVAKPMRDVGLIDDHVTLHDIGGIPCIDVIDFEYPSAPKPGEPENRYWHTQEDTPDKCSALSLAKVGWVVLEWLKSQ